MSLAVFSVLNFLTRKQSYIYIFLLLEFFLFRSCFCSRLYRAHTLLTRLLISNTDINDCASHPCENNGTCTDGVKGFNCSCAKGFNGIRCERGNRKVRDNITTPIFCMSSKTTMFTSEWGPIKSGVFSSDWQSLEKGKRQALSIWLLRPRRN